jgi:TolB-like protein/Tfp pilus assembly protein PilF
MPQQRGLVAIMFTDIESYSAVMQQDESRAIGLRTKHRKILEDEHERHHGRIVQYYGDGSLSTFQSAVEAVQSAIASQLLFRQEGVPVRIGLHIGDVLFNNDQVFGDGVNLASRIESLGVAGSILLSDKVHDEISNHPQFRTESMGVFEFKNIDRPVEVFAIEHEYLIVPQASSLKGKTKDKNFSNKSVAVFPFVNLNNEPGQEYFGNGIAEEILNSLTGLKDLKVAGRTSSFQLDRNASNLREIGEKLGVSTVLEGSVQKQGSRLRVTVQLINVQDGFHLWSEKYDRNADDIFAIQDEVALAVTEKLKVTLLEAEKTKIIKTPTRNTEAYELYLKGRFYVNRRGTSIATAIHYFERAIALDPQFALAHTGYADANLMAAFYGLVPAKDVLLKAKNAAQTAIELDSTLCEPYTSLGYYYACFEWNWNEAEKNFRKSLELNPKYAQAHYWYGLFLLAWVRGDFFGAEKHGRIALELDPLNAICHGTLGSILHVAGKYQEALQYCKSGVELDTYSFTCNLYLGWCYHSLKQYKEAIAAFEHLSLISNKHHFSQNSLILAYCSLWRFDKARELKQELKERAAKEFISPMDNGLSSACFDELDEAFNYLEQAFHARDAMLLSLRYEHWVPDNLRDDPRFAKLLERIGFP